MLWKTLIFLSLIGPCLTSLAQTEAGRPALNAAKEHYVGLVRQDSAKPFAAVPARLTLANESLWCEISSTAGNIVRVAYVPKNRTVIEQNDDAYVYVEERRTVSEKDDRVTGYREPGEAGGNGFDLLCCNGGLPDLEITKEYRLASDRLIKTVYFRATSGRNDGKLFLIRSNCRLDKSFYQGGCFYRPTFGGGTGPGRGNVPFVPGAQVTARTENNDMHNALFVYVQPAEELGVAQYRFKVNGYFERPLTAAAHSRAAIINDHGFFNPDGWEMYFTGDIVRKGDFLSVESHIMLFRGDAREFHHHYLDLPEYAERARCHVPDWYHQVKGIGGQPFLKTVQNKSRILQQVRNLASTCGPDECLMWEVGFAQIDGDYNVDVGPFWALDWGPPFSWSYKTSPEEIKQVIDEIRNVAPGKLKMGPYTAYGYVSDKSKIWMEQHPNWLARDAKGMLIRYGGNGGITYLLNPVTEEQRAFLIAEYVTLAKYFDLDFTYIDGGHGEFINYLPEKTFVHNYHAGLIESGIKRAIEGLGKAHYRNDSVVPEIEDGGFFECGRPDHELIDRKDWRTLSNAMYLSKYYTRYGADNPCNLWWSSQGTTNRNVMYGLMPEFWIFYSNNPSHILLTNDLGFEVKRAQLVDGDHVHPNWWNFETETLESALLKQGESYLLPLVSHKECAGREQVSVKLAGLGLKPGRPIYVWTMQPLIDSGLDYMARTPGALDTVASQFKVIPAADTLDLAPRLKPNILSMVAFTQVPAFVYSVNGRRNNFYLSNSRGVNIEGEMHDRRLELAVRSEASVWAEILAVLPEGCRNARVTVEGKEVEAKFFAAGGRLFVKVAVPKGNASVVVRETNGRATTEDLAAPKRYPYEDSALSFCSASGKPAIHAATKDGVACWEMKGPDLFLIGNGGPRDLATGGIALAVNAGDAKGELIVTVSGRSKRIPLNFSGWKEFSFTPDQFDKKEAKWDSPSATFSFRSPAGTVCVADFRFLPITGAEKPEAAASRKITVPSVPSAPKLDGEIGGDVWKSAATINFGGAAAGTGPQTTVLLLHDEKNLYVAARCPDSIMTLPPKVERDNESVLAAPNFTVVLGPKGSSKRFQFAVDPGASQWDGVWNGSSPEANKSWNGQWSAASSWSYNARWQVMLAIPFSDLGVSAPAKGEAWAAGFFRRSIAEGDAGWVDHGGIFSDPKNLGELVFD